MSAASMSAARPLRLLVYTDSGAIGGAELALGYLLGALSEEIEVGVLATDREVAAAIAGHRAGARELVVDSPQGSCDLAALREHRRAIRAFAPDVLHCNQAWPWACGYGEVAGLLTPGVRVVAVDHLPVSGDLPRLRRAGRRLLGRRMHAHVAVGDRAARLIEALVGLPVGAVGSVPNGVSVDLADTLPRGVSVDADTRPAHAATPVIGSLGRLTEQKGFDLLVRSLPSLPGATLVLVGDGPLRSRLEELAVELGVADRLRITGWMADARSQLATFDVFALPSLWEGMPLGILEAMHAGLPVVATDVGSVAEAVEDGVTGYVVASGDIACLTDRLRRLLADRSLRADMGERGRVLARERFTDTVMALRYEALYRAITYGRRYTGAARKFHTGSVNVASKRSRE
jgi:glycosyltransferase involved in cell wall biosynthesis